MHSYGWCFSIVNDRNDTLSLDFINSSAKLLSNFHVTLRIVSYILKLTSRSWRLRSWGDLLWIPKLELCIFVGTRFAANRLFCRTREDKLASAENGNLEWNIEISFSEGFFGAVEAAIEWPSCVCDNLLEAFALRSTSPVGNSKCIYIIRMGRLSIYIFTMGTLIKGKIKDIKEVDYSKDQ